jgi:hypothetical protein
MIRVEEYVRSFIYTRQNVTGLKRVGREIVEEWVQLPPMGQDEPAPTLVPHLLLN